MRKTDGQVVRVANRTLYQSMAQQQAVGLYWPWRWREWTDCRDPRAQRARVERLVAALRQAGLHTSAREIDLALWQRGQRPEFKARPRHRTRCTYYCPRPPRKSRDITGDVSHYRR
ncbi:MAG: hypothetical protein U5K56_00535 [Halioglobus sp.]|nr:hypothetical protein [Halioglobus sp.]